MVMMRDDPLLVNVRKARTAHDDTAIERQIVATDKQIDALLCELYVLAEDELRIA